MKNREQVRDLSQAKGESQNQSDLSQAEGRRDRTSQAKGEKVQTSWRPMSG